MSADLVRRWLDGWAAMNGHATSSIDGGWLITIGRPSRDSEIVTIEPSAATLTRLAERIAGDPGAMLTVFGRLPVDTLPGTRLERDDETLMTTALSTRPSARLPEGLRLTWDIDDHRTTCSLVADEKLAAHASVRVDGPDAVIDQVETMPAHRRRGLATCVMRAVESWAVSEGAATGILAASADGQVLYSRLGWRAVTPMWSFVGE